MKINLFAAAAMAALGLGGAAPAFADGGLSFIVSGTLINSPYSITNTSAAGEKIVGFGLSLAGLPLVFDTVDGGVPNVGFGQQFQAYTGGVSTGLVSSPFVPDGAKSFFISFNDFDPGETFQWLIDVDQDGSPGHTTAVVFGNELIGALGRVDFSNGLTAFGTLQAVVGNNLASQFQVTSVVPTPPIPGVPEPATWAMMLIGFGGLRAMIRSQRRRGWTAFS